MSEEAMPEPMTVSGIHEFIHGHEGGDFARILEFWAHFGFEPFEEGELHAAQAKALYGHPSDMRAVKLAHPGSETCDTGYVRLQFWNELASEGLGNAKAIDVGGRWMGIYTRDGLKISEAMHGEKKKGDHDWSLTPLVRAAFAWPEPEISLAEPFMGLREFVALGSEFRLAFVERVGFERPGFGTFSDKLPFQNTEGTHANIVQPVGKFSTDFYKEVFGLVTMANGEAHDSGEEDPTIEALKLDDGQTFCIERLVHPESPGGMLQVYSPYSGEKDLRDVSRIGARGLGCYSYRVIDIAEFRRAAIDAGAQNACEVHEDEFGVPAMSFDAPDGIQWIVSEQPE